jgi:cell division protease FtsH
VGGFTFPHQIYLTKTSIINKIKVLLAGGIAEEIIFGPEQASIGRSNDREQATILAVDYIRKYAFEREFQAYYISVGDYSMNFDDTDTAIEMMMKRLSAETTELLNEHKPYLLKLSQELRTSGNMKATEVQAVAQAHGVDAVVKEEGFLFIEAYGKDL